MYKFSGKGGNKKGAKKSAIILLLGLTRRRTAKTEQMEQQGVRREHTIQLAKLDSLQKQNTIVSFNDVAARDLSELGFGYVKKTLI